MENDCVMVPGLGGFVAHYTPAMRVAEENVFLPPTRIIGFNPQLDVYKRQILNNPAEVKLAVSKPAEKIVQAAYVCYENQKLGIIRSLFAEETPERVIIFASSKLKVKEVTKACLLYTSSIISKSSFGSNCA